MLISNSPECLQRYLDDLKSFCTETDLSSNLEKTKVMAVNNTQAWVTRSKEEFLGNKINTILYISRSNIIKALVLYVKLNRVIQADIIKLENDRT